MSAEEAWLEYRDSYSLRRGTNARRTARQLRKREFVAGYEAALAAAEASCGGCGCADRLRAEARRMAQAGDDRAERRGVVKAADFLDAAPDARGSDLSAEQPEVRASDLTGVYQSTSEPKTTMDDWLAARHDDQEATDG